MSSARKTHLKLAPREPVEPPRGKAAPFSIANYVELACLGQGSVVIDVELRGRTVGQVVVVRGKVWSAEDDVGVGPQAFRRLLGMRGVTLRCGTAAAPPAADSRNVDEDWESLLLFAEVDGAEESARDESPATAFDRHWESAVEALITKDYPAALSALLAARRISPNDGRVVANLARLEQLGYREGA